VPLEELEVVVGGEVPLEPVLELLQLVQALEPVQEPVLVELLRRRSLEQQSLGSSWHRASRGCRQRFSTAYCRGQSASCQMRS
jgi:hypothetical protein